MITDHGIEGVLAETARAAGLAPSVHNTQPWRWRVHPDHLDLYAERHRQLTATDAAGRLLVISCGAALDHAQVAMAALGWRPHVQRWPEPAEPDLLARLRAGEHTGASAAALRRFQAAERRRTDRRALTEEPVTAAALAAVRRAVEERGLYLHILRPEQLSDLAVAAARAQSVDDPKIQAELGYWAGGGPHPPGTGVPATAIPSEAPHTHVPVRDFGHPGELPPGQGSDRAATYAVLFGDEDAPAGWLAAGEALSAAWLTATEQGVSVLPFSAVVEAPDTRVVLRRLLSDIGHPYLVLRLGRTDPEHPGPPATERLDAAQTVEIVAGAR